MSNKPAFRSEQELYEHLKKFLQTQPHAVQLDGARAFADEGRASVYVWIESRSSWYVINGNTKRQAIEKFVTLFETATDKSSVLKLSRPEVPGSTLILSDSQRASGWYCFKSDRQAASPKQAA